MANVMAIHPIFVEIFILDKTFQPNVCASGKVRGIIKVSRMNHLGIKNVCTKCCVNPLCRGNYSIFHMITDSFDLLMVFDEKSEAKDKFSSICILTLYIINIVIITILYPVLLYIL